MKDQQGYCDLLPPLGILDLAKIVYPHFHWGKHHQFIATKFTELALGKFSRLALSQPPQTGKSTMAQMLIAWLLMNSEHGQNIILLSYESALAEGHSARAMNVIREEGWRTGVKLGNRQALSWWTTNNGGQVCAGSFMGGVTGRAGDLILIDDPLKNDEEANSPVIRAKLMREYNAAVETRLAPSGRVLITHTRWNPDDLTGQLLQQSEQGGTKWTYINLPALALENDPLGRNPGESIWEERYPTEFYENRKHALEVAGMGYQWNALYQGNPTSGNKLVEWPDTHFVNIFYDDLTKPSSPVKLRVQSLDPSKGKDAKTTGDYQAHVMIELLEDGLILVDSWLQRQTIEQMVEQVLHLWRNYQPNAVIIETGNLQVQIAELIKNKAKFLSAVQMPLYQFQNKLDKVVRIRTGLSPYLAQHRLKFRKTPSNMILVNQLRSFPTSEFDDGCDALELAIQMLQYLCSGNRRMATPLIHSV